MCKTTLTLKFKIKFFVYCNVFCSSRGAKVSTEPWCRKWSFLLEKLLVLIILKLALLTMCLRFAVRCKKNGSYWYRLILQIYRCILHIFLPLSFSFYFAFSFFFSGCSNNPELAHFMSVKFLLKITHNFLLQIIKITFNSMFYLCNGCWTMSNVGT